MTQHIINASAHDLPLPAGMFHCCTTSPPYFSLRRYEGQQEVDWPAVDYSPMPGLPEITIPAQRAALGLEDTPEAYIGHLVLCFREVWRCLRDDGCAFVVMGDSYAANPGQRKETDKAGPKQQSNIASTGTPSRHTDTLQAGDLMLIPHRLALALQADGWVLRNDVVWAKVAPMPESVSGWTWQRCRVKVRSQGGDMSGMTYRQMVERDGGWSKDTHPDTRTPTEYTPCPGCAKCEKTGGYVLRRGSWRHTRAHEYVLHLAKSMGYFADQERVREGLAGPIHAPGNKALDGVLNASRRPDLEPLREWGSASGRNPRSVLTGNSLVQLREDLSDEERQYALQELMRYGLL